VTVGGLVFGIFTLGLLGLGLRLLLLFFLLLGFGLLGGGAVTLTYGAYDLAYVHGLALVFGDGLEDAVLLGLDLEVDLIGLEFDERIA